MTAHGTSSGREVGGYVLLRQLGRGGMAEVWLGQHRVSRGHAAIKLLDPEVIPRWRAQFAREILAIARLSHPHIVSLYDVGPDHFAAAWIDGFDLQRRLRAPVAPAELLRMSREIASALAHAHDRGVVHRDVKPSNILIDRRDRAFLADFGLARLLDVGDDLAGRSGTPKFMAPEQGRCEPPGPTVDQYGLARTLLWALAGDNLHFSREEALARLPSDTSPRVRGAIRRATEVDPARRFAHIGEMAEELRDGAALTRPALSPLLRDAAPFCWCVRPTHVEFVAPGLARADYRLSALVADEPAAQSDCSLFLQDTGYADFGWSMYAATGRLGPIDAAAVLGRASEVIILMHGLFTSRAMWAPLALRLVRDNASAVVLVPDLHGFGESAFAAKVPPPSQLSPLGALTAVRDWRSLLGLANVPTVLMGSCYAASGLLAVGDEELEPYVSRVALTPSIPAFNPGYRQSIRLASSLMMPTLGGLPAVRRAVPNRLCTAQGGRRVVAPLRRELSDAAASMPRGRLVGMMRALIETNPVEAARLARCLVVTAPDDPVAPSDLIEAALAAGGMPRQQLFRLVGGGHYPLLESEDMPGWCARNADELVAVVDAALGMQRNSTVAATVTIGMTPPPV